MKKFDIYTHPKDGLKAVKKGFSWPGFFFGWIWAFYKGLVGAGFFIMLIHIVAVASDAFIGTTVMTLIVSILLPIIVGGSGNDWYRNRLLKNGYILMRTVDAASHSSAIALSKGNSLGGSKEDYALVNHWKENTTGHQNDGIISDSDSDSDDEVVSNILSEHIYCCEKCGAKVGINYGNEDQIRCWSCA